MTRNDKILIFVLKGYTLAQVGSIYNLTRERIKQIAVKTVKKHDSNLYYDVMAKYKTGSIKEFRKHKNRLISIIGDKK